MAQYKYSDREIKIAEWLGFVWQKSRHYSEDSHWRWPHGGIERFPRTTGGIPHFDNDDGAAISLFPVLVEKGFGVEISSSAGGWIVEIGDGVNIDFAREQPTIALAISVATLQLIESI